jgi:hypothetical protein
MFPGKFPNAFQLSLIFPVLFRLAESSINFNFLQIFKKGKADFEENVKAACKTGRHGIHFQNPAQIIAEIRKCLIS